jgi:hypothetical protein
MTIKGLNNFAAVWFTPLDQVDENNPAMFKVRGLTGSQQAEIMPDMELTPDGDAKITGRAMFLIIKYGLVDWDGIDDDNGPIRFSKNSKLNQDRLPYTVQAEIAGEIFELTAVDDSNKKKSS